MKRLIVIAIFTLFAVVSLSAQCTTQAGFVCITQENANRFFKLADEYIALKDAFDKLLKERGLSDSTLAAAQKLIEDYKQMMVNRDLIDAKKDALIAIYEKTIQLYSSLVDKLEAKINQPKSAFQKLLSGLKVIADIALGIAIGRAIP